MITDKLTATHNFLEELAKQAGKAGFMPASEIGLALQYLEEKGIPNNKHEDYKYCNIEAVLRKEFKTITGKEIALAATDLKKNYFIKDAYNVYVVNGKLIAEISEVPVNAALLAIDKTPADILKKYLAQYAQTNSDALIAVNVAYADRGVFLHVSKAVEKPVVVHHVNSSEGNLFFNVRNLFVIEKSAEVELTEIYHSSNQKYFTNNLTEIFVGENAHVNHTVIQHGGETSYTVNTTKTHQHKQSTYTNSCFTFSGALVRNNLNTAIAAEFAEAHLFGLFVTKGNQLVDNHTLVDHLKPNCQSNELYKGIVGGKSTAVFNGQIFVEKDAQKTNAYQSSKNILISDDATVNAKPELEIYANDVKCSHGTSTGKVDENALFYLKARGIGEESARKLLLRAFAHEVIDQLKNETIKEKVGELFEQALQD
ncbi:MAG TPA: Fe-S cluster assembly protein SufD [Bacteroidia bacterium]|jgi:Fe-S cluster assembly protein SufD|nr:Fe-S cluster assembly protein SufD [Bacteroidia bacterium]